MFGSYQEAIKILGELKAFYEARLSPSPLLSAISGVVPSGDLTRARIAALEEAIDLIRAEWTREEEEFQKFYQENYAGDARDPSTEVFNWKDEWEKHKKEMH